MQLGVCWYPEHWPERLWEGDVRRMRELGLRFVRLGEFAWSRLEPEPGRREFAWMDRAVDLLEAAGLDLILGTPTATPPKWLIDQHPEILPYDLGGRPRRFGSRRHYDFSSPAYRQACAAIVEAIAGRYGRRASVRAWQIDNEYGCHNTVISPSPAAAAGFRLWLKARYVVIQRLNEAWGTVFWSQEYRSFEEIDPPFQTVTEAHPAHRLDFQRFASEEVRAFNAVQVEILRRLSPGREITHNFMGFFTDFDHAALSLDLDFASWDSYPLGFLDVGPAAVGDKLRYLRRGHPDIAAFHHDLYRACGRGRFMVMEQQPGPVNWAQFNPAPAAGMVRLWTLEAAAHGAEAVSYFRWRQVPFGQEQLHAGLNRPDDVLDVGGAEAAAAARDLTRLGPLPAASPARVALVFSYESAWIFEIQPQGRGLRWIDLALETYSAVRRLGLDVDVVFEGADLTAYDLVICPSLVVVRDAALSAFRRSGALILFGPRSGSRTEEGQIPTRLPPGELGSIIGCRVVKVESLPPGARETVLYGGRAYEARLWRETLEAAGLAAASFADGAPALVRSGDFAYLAAWPGPELLEAIVTDLLTERGTPIRRLDPDVRLRTRGDLSFAFNFGPDRRDAPAPEGACFLIGSPGLGPGEFAVWRSPQAPEEARPPKAAQAPDRPPKVRGPSLTGPREGG